MFKNDAAIRQFVKISIGVAVLTALEVAVYALLDRFSINVLLGAIFGMAASCGNFLALTIAVSRAADRAEGGDPAKAKAAVQGSSVLRLLILLAIYIVVLKSTSLDPLAAVLPLVFVQIIIYLTEFFRKEGEKK